MPSSRTLLERINESTIRVGLHTTYIAAPEDYSNAPRTNRDDAVTIHPLLTDPGPQGTAKRHLLLRTKLGGCRLLASVIFNPVPVDEVEALSRWPPCLRPSVTVNLHEIGPNIRPGDPHDRGHEVIASAGFGLYLLCGRRTRGHGNR